MRECRAVYLEEERGMVVSDQRCKCLIVRASGEVVRCAAMVNDTAKSKYCYWHTKVMEGRCSSAPQDSPEYGIDNDYVLMYTDMDTLESVQNR
jgi:hypothetical protein